MHLHFSATWDSCFVINSCTIVSPSVLPPQSSIPFSTLCWKTEFSNKSSDLSGTCRCIPCLATVIITRVRDAPAKPFLTPCLSVLATMVHREQKCFLLSNTALVYLCHWHLILLLLLKHRRKMKIINCSYSPEIQMLAWTTASHGSSYKAVPWGSG